MGYTIYSLSRKRDNKTLILSLLVANLPDIDFLGNIFIKGFHHGPIHSFFMAIIFGITTEAILPSRGFLLFSIYLSHILLDYLIKDPTFPYGIMLLWPFNNNFYMAPFAFFPSFDYIIYDFDIFFSLHNLYTILFEILIFLPLVIIVKIYNRLKKDKIKNGTLFLF